MPFSVLTLLARTLSLERVSGVKRILDRAQHGDDKAADELRELAPANVHPDNADIIWLEERVTRKV